MTKTDKILSIMAVILIGGGFIGTPIANGYSNPVEFYQDVYERMNSETLSGTVYLKNVPIHLEGDVNFTQYDLDKLTEEVPDVLLQNCSEIYICDLDDPNSICYRFTSENHAGSGGFIVYNNSGKIFIDDDSNKAKLMIHELMHRYNEVYGFISKNQQVIDLYNQYSSQINEYATISSSEFLSESAVQYFLEPTKLKQNAQPVYDYFQSLFHYYA